MKSERVTAIFFLTVIMSFACLVSVGLCVKVVRKITAPPPPQPEIVINWEKLYPFKNVGTQKVFPKKESLKQRFEGLKYLIGYQNFVEAARKYDEVIGWNMASVLEYNPVIKLDDGYLAGMVVSRDVSKNARALRDFDTFCRENGAELVYINFPTKICKFQDVDVLDYANQNADRLLSMLKENGVKCYDFRKFLHDDGKNHHSSFFVTDHHWKPETGMWAAEHILKILRDDYDWSVNPEILNPENFNYVVYHDWFLGSQGKKLTLSRTKPDDISLIFPKFQTNIHCVIPAAGVDESGDFSVVYNMKHIEKKDYYHLNPYSTYVYSDQALTRITNMLENNSKRILLIHDSFSNSVIPFLALGIRYTDAIDIRYNFLHFNGSLENFVLTEKPDIVIVAYNSGASDTIQPYFDFR